MAKLSAYGQQEVARLEKSSEHQITENDLVVWERTTFAFMSNGRLLTKHDVQFRADGRKHSYGWKVHSRKFPKPEERQAAIERLKTKGYIEVRP